MDTNYQIPDNILEGYDIAGLMNKMAKADWYYEYSDDRDVWRKGSHEIKGISKLLEELCKIENGVTTANYLWDAYVPEHSVRRPDFMDSIKYLEELFKSFDWRDAMYDPLHDNIEATTEAEKNDLARMETLLIEWEKLYGRNPETAVEMAARYWEGHPMENYKDDFIKTKCEVMNTENLDYLKNNVRNHGFGETLGPELEAKIQQAVKEFTLAYKTEVNKREMEATLYFKKSDTTDLYFFNKYDTRVKNEKDETMSQTFYINKGWGVTLKEAYNLLNGRAVHKELTDKLDQKYQAWIQLDFGVKDKNGNYERKQYHQNYGYDVKEALSYYPIKEMLKEDDMKALVKSLEKGNRQMVTVQAPGGDIKVFIEANPQYKSINVYDNKMNWLDRDKREELMKKPELEKGKDVTKDKIKEQSLGTEGQDGKKPDQRKKVKGTSEPGDGLVKKNRNRGEGKGMGVH